MFTLSFAVAIVIVNTLKLKVADTTVRVNIITINCVSNQTDNNTGPHMDAWFVSKGLHICHLNVHYLYPKLDEIKILLREQKT